MDVYSLGPKPTSSFFSRCCMLKVIVIGRLTEQCPGFTADTA